MRKLGTTDLKIAPLVLGGNVFGWTADRETSFAILDAFLDAGFNAIDTADVYNRYAPGLQGGESETIIGAWMKDRGVRDRIVLITKGGLPMGDGMEGLGDAYLQQACAASLRRLQTDYIDVYMAHRSDPGVPVEETQRTFQRLIDAGQVRYAGCSNYTPEELAEAVKAQGAGQARYEVVQPLYNLIERAAYEDGIETICSSHGLGVITYYALAAGFLTGKYRKAEDLAGSARARVAAEYLTPKNLELINVMNRVAIRHEATLAQVSLAWIMGRTSVTAPIASATSLTQLREILQAAKLRLTAEDFADLDV